MSTSRKITFIGAGDDRLMIVRGGAEALSVGLGGTASLPELLLYVDTTSPQYRYHLLTRAEVRQLPLGDVESLRKALAELPSTRGIGEEETSTHRAVVLGTHGRISGVWAPLRRPAFTDGPLHEYGHSIGWLHRVSDRYLPPRHDYWLETGPLPRSQPPPPAPPQAGDARDPALRRTPHLDTPSTVPTAPGTDITVSVYTDDQPFDDDESGSEVIVEAPPDVSRIRLQVTLVASDHFGVRGKSTKQFDIIREQARSRPVTFVVRVADRPPHDEPAVITALFTYRGRVCGTVSKQWSWDPALPVAGSLRPTVEAAPKPLTVFTDARRPDLSVVITSVGDGQHFTSVVLTTLVPGYSSPTPQPWALPQQAPAMVSAKLAALIDPTTSAEERLDALKRSGYEFWDVAPRNFQEAYWKIIDSHRPLKSVYIASAEPCIPWELMIPNRSKAGSGLEERRALGVEHAIGRWCKNVDDLTAGPPTLPIRNSFVVTPRYRQMEPLDARDEVRLIRERLRGKRLRKASREAFDRYFLRNHASLLHFVCHGASEVDYDDVLYLDDDEKLRSASLRSSDGLKAMCRSRQPMVFINACSTGAQVPALAGGAGFPLAFGDIGARAIVAPLWPVASDLASRVAVELYERALRPGSPPVAEILRDLRSRAYDGPDADSFAAYAFFGDPTARMELVPDRGSAN